MTIVKEYLDLTEKYKKEYGEKWSYAACGKNHTGPLCRTNSRCGYDLIESTATNASNCAKNCKGSPFGYNQTSKTCYCGTDNYKPGTYGKCGIIDDNGFSIYAGKSSCTNLDTYNNLINK
jgi:hypothetical protein